MLQSGRGLAIEICYLIPALLPVFGGQELIADRKQPFTDLPFEFPQHALTGAIATEANERDALMPIE